jgi:hypothetical protein
LHVLVTGSQRLVPHSRSSTQGSPSGDWQYSRRHRPLWQSVLIVHNAPSAALVWLVHVPSLLQSMFPLQPGTCIPRGNRVHAPCTPARSHARQGPMHVALQHVACSQLPLLQSVGAAHASPLHRSKHAASAHARQSTHAPVASQRPVGQTAPNFTG